MSAFMFQLSHKMIKEASTKELEEWLICYKKVVAAFNWAEYQPCHFDSDMAVGYKANIPVVEEELEQRKSNIDAPLQRFSVFGYNPSVDDIDYPKRTGK